MEANAGYFSEQVTGVDSRGSLPLRYLCDNVKEHSSKLSHLQERKLGHSSRNCNLLLVKSCCCCSQVPALQACPAWGPDKPEKVLGEKITGAFMREPLSWQHENSEHRGRGQSRAPSVALLFFYVCSSLLICKLLQNRDADYFRFPRHGAWNRMALHKYYLSERRNMKTYTLLHWFHSKVGRSRKEAIFNETWKWLKTLRMSEWGGGYSEDRHWSGFACCTGKVIGVGPHWDLDLVGTLLW